MYVYCGSRDGGETKIAKPKTTYIHTALENTGFGTIEELRSAMMDRDEGERDEITLAKGFCDSNIKVRTPNRSNSVSFIKYLFKKHQTTWGTEIVHETAPEI